MEIPASTMDQIVNSGRSAGLKLLAATSGHGNTMKRRGALQIPILVLAAGCGRGGLSVSAIRDGGLVAEVSPDRISRSPDLPELVYRQSTQQFVQISASDDETCGLKSDGSMLCWGYFGDFPVSSAFGTGYVPRPPSEGWKQVSLWGGLACGIQNDDTLVCWGLQNLRICSHLGGPTLRWMQEPPARFVCRMVVSYAGDWLKNGQIQSRKAASRR